MLRRFLTISISLMFATLLLSSCGNRAGADDKGDAKKENSVTEKITLDVKGMTCSGCEYSVEAALKKVKGVTIAEADFVKEKAVVDYDPKVVKVEQLVEAVNKTGYKATAPEKKDKETEGKESESSKSSKQ
ncbi:MAG: cation transporter [bacterium]